MQSGTNDHSIVQDTEADLGIPNILLRCFHEYTTFIDFGLSFPTEKRKSGDQKGENIVSEKADAGFCRVFPLNSEVWGTIWLYRTLGILLKYVAKLYREVSINFSLQLITPIEM